MASSQHELDYDSLSNPRQVWNTPPGTHEEGLGCLILLTPEVVAHAASTCIKNGRRISLGWDLNQLDVASFNQQPTQHHIVSLLGGLAFDDVYIFNPQQSSQWDGLRHFSPPHEGSKERLFYGGTTATDSRTARTHG